MKAVLVIDSVSRAAGGILDAERRLHQSIARLGVETAVLSLDDVHSVEDLPGWAPLVPRVFRHIGPFALGASPALRRAISNESGDLIYRAGIWRLPSKYAHGWTRKNRRPEIIAPHGMLDPWAVRNSRWKKRLAHLWFEGAHLRDAACIRALCESEARAIRAYGLKNPICVVPNGIDLPHETENRRQELGKKFLLSIGRLHPKKGLPNALRAWRSHQGSKISQSKSDEWLLVIAGWSEGGHEAELKLLCDELGLKHANVPAVEFLSLSKDEQGHCHQQGASALAEIGITVVFVGPVFGNVKAELLRCASAFILPSFSEGLPMAILEAWAYGLPVLMTDHCNLPSGFEAEAAIRIGTDVESIAAGMMDLFRSSVNDLRSTGNNGRLLVSERFTWLKLAAQMKDVYEWALGGGSKPGFLKEY